MFGFGGTGTSPADGYGQAAATMGEAGIGNVGGKDVSSSAPSTSSPAGGAQAAGGYADGSRDAPSGPAPSSPAGGAQAAGGYSDGSRDASYSGGSSDNTYSGGANPTGFSGGIGAALGEAGSGTPSVREAESGSMAALARDASAVEAALGDRTPTGFTPTLGGLSSALSPSRPDNSAYAGPKGTGWSVAQPTFTPSARQAEDASMSSLYASTVPSARQAQEESMSALSATSMPTTARSVEDRSMAQQNAWQGLLSVARRDAAATDPYNSLTYGRGGARTPSHVDLENMTIKEVQDYQSGMRARGHASTAVGAYQMIASTLASTVAKSGLDPNTTKFSRSTQDFLAQELMSDAARRATNDGKVNVDRFADNLAGVWASFKDASGKGKYDGFNQNKGYVSYDTVRDAASALVDAGASFAGVKGPSRSGFAETPAANAPTPTSRPSFSESYLTSTASSRISDPQQREIAAYKDYGRSRDYAPAEPVRSDWAPRTATGDFITAPPETQSVPTTPQDQTRPADQAPNTQTVTVDDVTRPSQTMPGRIAAGGIDVLSGMIPGIGTAVGVANAGLALTGNRTIGQRAVDFLGNMEGGEGTFEPNTEAGSGLMYRDGEWITPEEAYKPAEAGEGGGPKKPRSFVDRYLRDYDTPWRPTPAQKWSRAA